MRKKPNLIPRMERCAHLYVREPETMSGHWRDLLPGCRALHVEVGCGKGRFTAEMAALYPDTLFVAVERVNDAMVVGMERCSARELKNVFFVTGDAAQLGTFFAPDEVDRLYLNFCDPWPAKRHAKRRLTAPSFLRIYRAILCAGGEIWFKTDNAPLFSWSLDQFTFCGYHLREVTRDLHRSGPQGVMTDYEEKFYALGTPINRCVAENVGHQKRSVR